MLTHQILGERIRAKRMAWGITLTELAAELEISYQQMQKYEQGSNRISALKLKRVADYLQTPISYFYGEEDDDGPYEKGPDWRKVIKLSRDLVNELGGVPHAN